jgi:hypothetical protein
MQLAHQPSPSGHRHHLLEQQLPGGRVEQQQMLSQSHTHSILFKEDWQRSTSTTLVLTLTPSATVQVTIHHVSKEPAEHMNQVARAPAGRQMPTVSYSYQGI